MLTVNPQVRAFVCLRRVSILLACLIALFIPSIVPADWVDFVDETGSRLTAPAGLGVSDPDEKDYAWGDVDKDGDIDLVIVRKEPFTSPGKRPNVLLMNEGGVLVDRTALYASASDVSGDNGFLTPTNDRDVKLVDVDNDSWLDVVTAVTISDGNLKSVGHPRIYINLGEDGGQNWLGFRYEEARIPTMLSYSSQSGFNPRFCSVAVGDVTGDGFVDLWFGDYDSSGAGGFGQPAGADYNDRLLVNQGNGFFLDETQARFSGLVSIPGSANAPFEVSAFGAAAAIEDINSDGFLDIVKQTSLNDPLYVGVAYNELSTNNEGFFATYDVVYQQSPYFVSVGDLNKDNLPDMVITDDGPDRFVLNQGNNLAGVTNWLSFGFSYDAAGSDGFGSNSVIADLDNDGWNDVLIADVDVDIDGCGRRMHIYRNLGGAVGGNVTLQEQTSGTDCQNSFNNPPQCIVTGIPSDKLKGVHDMAVFDIDGDGRKDMVVGRCSGTEIYRNVPQQGLTFVYPQGLPFFVEPNQAFDFEVQVNGFGATAPVPGSAKMFAAVDGAPFSEIALTDLGSDLYQATLPAAPNCADRIEFYFTADGDSGAGTFSDPSGAPANPFRAIAAVGTQTIFEEDVEGDVSGWTVVNDPLLTSGGWEQAEPNGTVGGIDGAAAPPEDADAAQDKLKAFVTENGPPGGAAADNDVDGGPTDLISPVFDLSGTDATISYSRWFYTSGDDSLEVSVTADGTNWVLAERVIGVANTWQVSSFQVGDFVTPSSTVQVRFRVEDLPNNSVTEAAIDSFLVERLVCQTCTLPAECDDGNYCNGVEDCVTGICVSGLRECPGQVCEEATDTCFDCINDIHCSDGDFCNGAETCVSNSCVPASDPCSGQYCDEGSDTCVECLVDAHCTDGVFCNGLETCITGSCAAVPESCPGRLCDEVGDVCVGSVPLQPNNGDPLLGLTSLQLDRFFAGKASFIQVLDGPGGLGPVFNQNSCAACHNNPVGGAGSIMVTRFGQADQKGGGFDPLDSLGGSLLQAEGINGCLELVPPEANVTSPRLTNSILGFGLVEAIADADIEANAIARPPGVSGVAHTVQAFEDPGVDRIGRFGWKSQVATLLTFSADAALNEMGLTNRFLTSENAPNGDQAALAICDTVADPEDGPDGQGQHFIDRVTDFQRFLAAPPQTPRSGMSGESVFNNIGCASCHVSTFTTRDDPGLEDAIRNKTLRPYSDFLLHDMGGNADFIEQGDAEAREIRTTPLWGLRIRDPLWHDGRITGGTFQSRMIAAVQAHGALGSEARNIASAFLFLEPAERDQVFAFLDSLGRAEFDSDGDGDVDQQDEAAFNSCFSGPGPVYTADDPCALHDVDQDGDVDADDQDLFILAAGGPAGRVPDGFFLPGTPLIVGKAAGTDLNLTWSDSCDGSDGDYEIYEGIIGDFTSHISKVCSTGGSTSETISPAAGDVYYLVVPNNGFREGSYGTDSTGGPRPQAVGACLPQTGGGCS